MNRGDELQQADPQLVVGKYRIADNAAPNSQ